jgi:hypothetical protein
MSSSASPSNNLIAVMRAFVDLVNEPDPATIAQLLAPHVVWQGLEPDLRCDGREQVLAQMTRGFSRISQLTAFSASARGDEVAVSIEGPHLREGFDPDLEGRAHLVLTFAGGAITTIRATRHPRV